MFNCYGYNGHRLGYLTVDQFDTSENAIQFALEKLCALTADVVEHDNDIPQGYCIYTEGQDGPNYCAKLYAMNNIQKPYEPANNWSLKIHTCGTHTVVEYKKIKEV